MANVLTFYVGIEDLEKKIYRIIEISDKRTVADLAYTILASFDSLAYHLYDIKHGQDRYDCMIDPLDLGDYIFKDATKTKLSEVDFEDDNKMIMEYDFGSTTTFIITYLDSRIMEKYNARHYPYIVDGKGRGMLDDVCGFELKEIVEDIDKKGYSDYYFSPGYERSIIYDYRDYDIKGDNILLKGTIELIKNSYEFYE